MNNQDPDNEILFHDGGGSEHPVTRSIREEVELTPPGHAFRHWIHALTGWFYDSYPEGKIHLFYIFHKDVKV